MKLAWAVFPIFTGWYADPDLTIYNGLYWIFPTTSVAFEEQLSFDAFSSPDRVTWTKHPDIITTDDVAWVRDSFWAATSVRSPQDGRYYLYFTANGLLSQEADAGIGVAVADWPQGPYKDALGRRLVDTIVNGANPMDPDVLIDDDGKIWFYFGGTAANVGLLSDDMISFQPLPNAKSTKQLFKDITPTSNFVEGIKVFKRKGVYYMMWSENGYGSPTYQVNYGMSDSPMGPFDVQSVVLQQDPKVAVATGHNGVVNVPGTDEWYIAYHRRPLNETDPNHRVVALDRMEFYEDGTIQQVKMT